MTDNCVSKDRKYRHMYDKMYKCICFTSCIHALHCIVGIMLHFQLKQVITFRKLIFTVFSLMSLCFSYIV